MPASSESARDRRLRSPLRATAVALASLLSVSLSASLAAAEPNALKAKLEAQIAAAHQAGFSGFVRLVASGEDVIARGVGSAQPGADVPITSQTVFDIGSVSKEFTRALLLDLATAGSLPLDAQLGRLLRDVPSDKQAITVQQLLDHTAGLEDYVDRPGEDGDFTRLTRDEALTRILGQTLLFPPGADKAYSNSGYTLLAILIETVTEKPFAQTMRERILEPAGMTSTGFYRHGWDPQLVAVGKSDATFGKSNSPAEWPEISWAMLGNGGMVASANDLAAWDRAIVTGTVLSASAREQMLPRLRPETGSTMAAGANDFGFCTVVARLADDRQIYVLGNSGIDRTETLAKNLAAIWDGREPADASNIERTQDDGFPPSPLGQRFAQVHRVITDASKEELSAFLEESFTEELFDAFSLEEHLELWGQLQDELGDSTVDELRKTGPTTGVMTLRAANGEQISITVEIEPDEPHRIQGMMVD